ncbi:MAG: hypothetical protein SFH39_00110 [Candidatus Magnetobacterium sp. LHC-1]
MRYFIELETLPDNCHECYFLRDDQCGVTNEKIGNHIAKYQGSSPCPIQQTDDYADVVHEQIQKLKDIQKNMPMSVENACRIAETITELCLKTKTL